MISNIFKCCYTSLSPRITDGNYIKYIHFNELIDKFFSSLFVPFSYTWLLIWCEIIYIQPFIITISSPFFIVSSFTHELDNCKKLIHEITWNEREKKKQRNEFKWSYIIKEFKYIVQGIFRKFIHFLIDN